MPQPPSTVALPPMPMMISSTPLPRAARIISPVPKVEVFMGSRSSFSSRTMPEAAAISRKAVPPATPISAFAGRPRGSRTVHVTSCPPAAAVRARTVPSPPSASGTQRTSASGIAARIAAFSISAARSAVRDPLNLSGARTIFTIRPLWRRRACRSLRPACGTIFQPASASR